VRFGDSPVVLLAALMLAIAAWRGRNRGR
jgi:hypothetical protein